MTTRKRRRLRPAAAYIRVSSKKQAETEKSPKEQLAEIEKYAERAGFVIEAVYEDLAISGRKTKRRREYVRLMDDVEDGAYEAVIFWNQARFSRQDPDIVVSLFSQLNRSGVEIHDTVECKAIDVTTIEGLIMTAMRASANAEKSIQTSQDTKRALQSNFDELIWHGAIPYGYGTDENKRLVINKAEAPFIRRLYKLYDEGNSLTVIAKLIKADAKKLGVCGDRSYLGHRLRQPVYKGVYTCGGRHVENAHDAIIKPSLWNRVNERLDANAPTRTARGSTPYVLSSLVHCCKCGSRMCGHRHKASPHTTYRCRNEECDWRGTFREAEIVGSLLELVQSDAMWNAWVKATEKMMKKAAPADPGKMKREMDRLAKKIAHFEAELLEIPRAHRGGAVAKIEELKAQREGIEYELSQLDRVQTNADDVIATASKWFERLQALTPESDPAKLREAFRAMFASVDVETTRTKTAKRYSYSVSSAHAVFKLANCGEMVPSPNSCTNRKSSKTLRIEFLTV